MHDLLGPKLSGMFYSSAMLETFDAYKPMGSRRKESDFVAIGTSDMIANLLDCPRDSEQMSAYEPAIYPLLQQAAQQAGVRTKEIQLNGQLIRMPGVQPVLIGLGFRIFSVDPSLIPYLAENIKQTDTKDAAQLAQQICQAADSNAVKKLMAIK